MIHSHNHSFEQVNETEREGKKIGGKEKEEVSDDKRMKNKNWEWQKETYQSMKKVRQDWIK